MQTGTGRRFCGLASTIQAHETQHAHTLKRVTDTIRTTALLSRTGRWLLSLGLLLGAAVAIAAIGHFRTGRLQQRLLASAPEDIITDPSLMRFASAQARPLYVTHCAACHGPDLHGNSTIGAPNLTDGVWLYGDGSLYAIERTILYGVRTGNDRSHNETDMPAFGLRGILSPTQIESVVQYLLQLSGRPYLAEGANAGRTLYMGAGNCGDCHGPDGRGNNDYGAPDLTRNVWNSGSDPQSLYKALYFGEHRIMPAWRGSLSLEQIRALATYVYASSNDK